MAFFCALWLAEFSRHGSLGSSKTLKLRLPASLISGRPWKFSRPRARWARSLPGPKSRCTSVSAESYLAYLKTSIVLSMVCRLVREVRHTSMMDHMSVFASKSSTNSYNSKNNKFRWWVLTSRVIRTPLASIDSTCHYPTIITLQCPTNDWRTEEYTLTNFYFNFTLKL